MVHVPLWSAVAQDSGDVGQCAEVCEAVSPCPEPLLPRAPRAGNALVEICNFDYLITSQIVADLKLWPEEGQTRSILLSLEHAASHVGAADFYQGRHCQRAAVCTSTLCNLGESTSAGR